MHNILVLSNNAVSNSESNGRIHSYTIKDYLPNHVSNFYLRGCADIEGVNYLSFSPKNAFFNKISFGLIKIKANNNPTAVYNPSINKSNPKSRKAFFHLLRYFSFCNRSILKNLKNLVVSKKIDTVVVWGCNVPFLYKYASILSKECSIRVVTFTGEDYPLKKYNYLGRKHDLFFKFYQHKLNRNCAAVYKNAYINLYATNDLKNAYESAYDLSGGEIIHFSSNLENVHYEDRKIKNIFYGGNLYTERAKSLVDIAEQIEKFNDVYINVCGKCDNKTLNLFSSCSNIKYLGVLPYDEVVKLTREADLLLHIEGFSQDYIKDCKFAFSTKISDYYMLNLPFFVYGPIEISGVRYAHEMNEKFVATSREDLKKLDLIIQNKVRYKCNYSKVLTDFSIQNNLISKFLERSEK